MVEFHSSNVIMVNDSHNSQCKQIFDITEDLNSFLFHCSEASLQISLLSTIVVDSQHSDLCFT